MERVRACVRQKEREADWKVLATALRVLLSRATYPSTITMALTLFPALTLAISPPLSLGHAPPPPFALHHAPPPPPPSPPPVLLSEHADCPAAAVAEPPPSPPGCTSFGPLPDYHPTDTTAFAPATLTGCPVTVSGLVDETTSIYFKLTRPSPVSRLMYTFNWGPYAPPRIVFGFGNGGAYDDQHGSCVQFAYHTPGQDASHFGEYTWFEDVEDSRDVYHCKSPCSCYSYCGDGASSTSPSACAGPYANTNGGDLYITITGKYVRETVRMPYRPHTPHAHALQL